MVFMSHIVSHVHLHLFNHNRIVGHGGFIWVLTILKNAALNIFAYESLSLSLITLLREMLRDRNIGSKKTHQRILVPTANFCLLQGLYKLHSYQQWPRVPITSHLCQSSVVLLFNFLSVLSIHLQPDYNLPKQALFCFFISATELCLVSFI